MSRTHRLLPLLVAVATLAACGESPTVPGIAPSPQGSPARVTVSTAPGWREVVDGETGPGTSYRLYMPEHWNGRLVTYAHGIVAPFLPVALPAEGDGMAAIFGAQGYAVALSSYKETGLAMKDGAQRTHQLRGLFAARYGQPVRSYLAGSSMGGYIVARMAEEYSTQYDGVLPLCGVVGGFQAELQYVLHARALFDFFYANALPGTPKSVAMPSDPVAAGAAVAGVQLAAATAIGAHPAQALFLAMTDQASMPLPAPYGPLTPAQFGEFVVTPLVLQAVFANDIVEHSHGFPMSNVGVTYSSAYAAMMPPGTLDAINAGVERVSADPAAVNWVRHNGETSGRIALPTLTLHTRYDTWVPIATEAIYRDRVAAAGRGDLLVQRTTEGFGHCNFTPAEIGRGMADLANWVENGVKPAP